MTAGPGFVFARTASAWRPGFSTLIVPTSRASKFWNPPVSFTVNVSVPDATPYGDVEREIRAAAPDLLESVSLLDVYRGPQAGAGKKSFAFRLVFRSATGTLSDADVERAMKRVTGRLERSLGAVIRT